MSTQHQIRWSENDYERLRRAVKNAKEKNRRLGNKYEEGQVYMMDIPSFTELRDSIHTRAELNKTINNLNKYSAKGGENKYLAKSERRSASALRTQYKRTVQLFNNKVDQLNKIYAGTGVVIPEKIELITDKKDPRYKDSPLGYLKKSSDLSAEIKSLTDFLKRGSDDIVGIPETNNTIKMTRWQFDYINQKADYVNDQRAERLKEFEERVKEQNVDPGKRGSEYTGYLPTKKFNKHQTIEDIQRKMRQLRKEGRSDYWLYRDELAKQTYIQRLKDEYGTGNKYANEIIKELEEMDIETWKEIFRQEPEEFDLLYGVDKKAKLQHLAKLYETWVPANTESKTFLQQASIAYSSSKPLSEGKAKDLADLVSSL